MGTIAFKMKLKPGFKEEYERRHQEIWPELVSLLKQNGISEYYIFHDEATDILFAVQEQGRGSSQDLGHHQIVQKWWNYMADIMETNPDNSPVSEGLECVFHLK